MITIIPFEQKYAEAFKQANLLWLDEYGLTESHDLMMLNDPEGMILKDGGYIFLAVNENGKLAGTAALIKENAGDFELVKMTVVPEFRGLGISHQLIDVCINQARNNNAKKIHLFSNHKLDTAIRLYEQKGFKHVPVEDSPFQTADIKMELIL